MHRGVAGSLAARGANTSLRGLEGRGVWMMAVSLCVGGGKSPGEANVYACVCARENDGNIHV